MQHPPPAGVLPGNALVVLAHCEEGEGCVVCESVEYHTTKQLYWEGIRWESVPLTVRGEHSLSWDRFCRPIDQSPYLDSIQGGTLEWWGRKLGHTVLILVATGLPGEPLALRFSYVHYVDCPTVMHNVRVRMATAEEREALSQRVSRRLADRFERELPGRCNVAMAGKEALVTIECDEGVFSIWAGVLLLSWRDRGSKSNLFDLRTA